MHALNYTQAACMHERSFPRMYSSTGGDKVICQVLISLCPYVSRDLLAEEGTGNYVHTHTCAGAHARKHAGVHMPVRTRARAYAHAHAPTSGKTQGQANMHAHAHTQHPHANAVHSVHLHVHSLTRIGRWLGMRYCRSARCSRLRRRQQCAARSRACHTVANNSSTLKRLAERTR